MKYTVHKEVGKGLGKELGKELGNQLAVAHLRRPKHSRQPV